LYSLKLYSFLNFFRLFVVCWIFVSNTYLLGGASPPAIFSLRRTGITVVYG